MHKRDGGVSSYLSSPTDVLPPWQSTINLWNKKSGLQLKPLDASAGNKPIRLFPRSSAVSECDNYTFSFPSQPSGDGRFSILSHTLSLRETSPYGFWWVWRLGKKSSCSRLAAGIHIKLLPFAAETLVALCKYCHHWPAEVYISTSEHQLSCQQMSCFQSLFHIFFCYFVRFQAETVNITITCDLARPSVENNFHAHLFRPSHKQGPKVAGSCITLIQLPLS